MISGTLHKRITLGLAAIAVAVGFTVVAPVGSSYLGAGKAEAACGWYQQYAPNRIVTTSYNCEWYFDNNGWYLFQVDDNGSGSWTYWMARDGT